MPYTKAFYKVFWIYLLQFSTVLLPLITLPYANSILGLEGVAFFGTTIAIGGIWSVICEYSFDLSGIKDVIGQDNKDLKNKSLVSRLYAQWIIFIITFLSAIFIITIIDSKYLSFLFGAALVVLSNICFPFWVSQLMSTEKVYAIFLITARILSFLLIYYLLPFFKSGMSYLVLLYTPIIISLLIYMYISLGKNIHLVKLDFDFIKNVIKSSLNIFISRLFSAFYQNGGVIALTLIASPEATGLYAIADRVRKAALLTLMPLTKVIYPIACTEATQSKSDGYSFISTLYTLYIAVSIFLTISIYYCADIISEYFTNEEAAQLSIMIKCLSILPIISSISVILGQFKFLASNNTNIYTKTIYTSVALFLFLVFPMTSYFSIYGTILSIIITETVMSLLFVFYWAKLSINK